jgi:HEAT repeat protein
LAERGAERELAEMRTKWQDEIEGAARSSDFRERALAYRAIGQFRYRQKLELLRRGLEDESPASRGSALLSLELLSRDSPGAVNADRSLLHTLASSDSNAAVRRLAILVLKNGSPHRDTIGMLEGIADDDELDRELRETARRAAAMLTKKGRR